MLWVAKLIGAMMPMVTPAIKDELEVLLKKLHDKAIATDNPIDDYLTQFLLDIMGIK
jgi:hypothetical protein